MRKLVVIGIVVLVLLATALLLRFEFAPMPAVRNIANPERFIDETAYDVFGRRVSFAEAEQLRQTPEGLELLSLRNGAIALNDDFREFGRRAFYKETFGNEYFMTDVMGLTHGALTVGAVTRAVLALALRGTDDLQVRLAQDVTIGERTYRRGELVRTGIDVPRGWIFPLGMKVAYDRGRIRIGGTCALCHASVDPQSRRVIEGAPNANLEVGLLFALATNSAAYLGHVSIEDIGAFIPPDAATVTGSTGEALPLPDVQALERAVDGMLAAWAPGNFDSTPDGVNNPAQIPDSFTAGDHPFGWTGFSAVGPFRGLNVLANNVHGLNADMTTVALGAHILFGMDPEVYLGALLQNASNPRFRYDPASGERPSDFLRRVSPRRGQPFLVQNELLPTYPQAAWIATHSMVASVPGYPLWHHISAMSAYQDSLLPPRAEGLDREVVSRGRTVFEQAGCAGCHSGPAFTDNRVLPVAQVGTQPSRAGALHKQSTMVVPSMLYPLDTPVPVPPGTPAQEVPVTPEQREQVRLGFAEDRAGGYKVKGLIGLAVTAPYLHDGGVAVGPDPDRHLGLAGTLYTGIRSDPRNSLRALVDRELRARVIAANEASPAAQASRTSGAGHEFYVDEAAGFAREQQDALIDYLLSLSAPAVTAPSGRPQETPPD
jgi:hypothetical protein